MKLYVAWQDAYDYYLIFADSKAQASEIANKKHHMVGLLGYTMPPENERRYAPDDQNIDEIEIKAGLVDIHGIEEQE